MLPSLYGDIVYCTLSLKTICQSVLYQSLVGWYFVSDLNIRFRANEAVLQNPEIKYI